MKIFWNVSVAVLALLCAGLSYAAAQSSPSPAAAQRSTKESSSPGTATSQAKVDPAKEADIRRLLELVGTKALTIQMMDSMSANMKPVLTNALPAGEYRAKLVDLFFAKFQKKADIQVLLDFAVAAYDKNFSHEEIKGLVKFYDSPLGKKVSSALPAMTKEIMDKAQSWGEQLGQNCMREVLNEHPEMAEAMEAAGRAAQPR